MFIPELAQRLPGDFRRAREAGPLSDEALALLNDHEGVGVLNVLSRDPVLAPLIVMPENDGTFTSPQTPMMGVLAMRTLIRSTLLALSPVEAAGRLSASEFMAPRLSLLYNGLYPLVEGFLATQGWIIDWRSRPPSREPRDDGNRQKSAIAKLTRSGAWALEGTIRSHSKLWATLESLLTERGLDEVSPSIGNFLQGLVQEGPNDLGDPIEMGTKAVIRAREWAQYQGFAFDMYAFEEMTNGGSPAGLGRKVTLFEECARGLVMENVRAFEAAYNAIAPEDWNALLPRLQIAIHDPTFELLTPSADRPLHELAQPMIDAVLPRTRPRGIDEL